MRTEGGENPQNTEDPKKNKKYLLDKTGHISQVNSNSRLSQKMFGKNEELTFDEFVCLYVFVFVVTLYYAKKNPAMKLFLPDPWMENIRCAT